jgi:hypothetical protein
MKEFSKGLWHLTQRLASNGMVIYDVLVDGRKKLNYYVA